MAFDRKRAEALNADHHRRMAADAKGRVPPVVDANIGSRANICNAIAGCANRYGIQTQDPWILEIGAGYAGDRAYLLERFGGRYVGMEVVESVAQSARERGRDVLHMAFEDAPSVYDAKFDIIYSRHVMEHVTDVPTAMKALKRLLAPKGIIGAVTPHYFPDPEPAHVSQLTISQWMAAYRAHGFDCMYAVEGSFACAEAHLVCVHKGAVSLV